MNPLTLIFQFRRWKRDIGRLEQEIEQVSRDNLQNLLEIDRKLQAYTSAGKQGLGAAVVFFLLAGFFSYWMVEIGEFNAVLIFLVLLWLSMGVMILWMRSVMMTDCEELSRHLDRARQRLEEKPKQTPVYSNRQESRPVVSEPAAIPYPQYQNTQYPAEDQAEEYEDYSNSDAAVSESSTADEIDILSAVCLTDVPSLNSTVDYVAEIANLSPLFQNVTIQPIVRHISGTMIPIVPFEISLQAGEKISTAFSFVPKKPGEYDIEISTMANGVLGASFIGKTITVEGAYFEILSASAGSTELSPNEEMPIQVTVANSGNSEISVDVSAVISQNHEPVVEVYLGESTILAGGMRIVTGTILAPEKEGRYALEIIARSGSEERRSLSSFTVTTGADVTVLDMPDHVSAGERFTLHVEVANRGRARTWTVVVTGNGIDEVTRQVSLGANERKIVPVEMMARKTMEMSEMDMKVLVE